MPKRTEIDARFSSHEELGREFWRVWSEEGVEQVLAQYETFFTEDAVWSPVTAQVAGHDYSGRDGFAEYVGDFHDTFRSFGGELLSIEELSDGIARSEVRVSAEMLNGGVLEANLFTLTRFRGGRVEYGWGTYDPKAAEQKLEEFLSQREDA